MTGATAPPREAALPQTDGTYTPWNADTSAVNLGMRGSASYSGGIPGPAVPNRTNVYEVSTTWLTNLKANDEQGYRNLKGLLRAGGFLGARANSPSAVKNALQDAAAEAAARLEAGQSTGTDVIEYLQMRARSGDGSGSSGSRSGGRSAAANLPVVDRFGDEAITMLANDTAMALVGRELNKRELRAIVKDIRKLEDENPAVTRVVGGRVERSGGLSAAVIQDLVQERAGQIATKGLDAAGPLNADAAKNADELRQWAKANGLGLSDSAISKYTRKVLLGETTLDDVKGDLRRTYLSGMYPAWADKIAAGEDPSDFLSPYVSAAQKFLERDDITMDDPLVQRMTQYTDQSGKPAVMPLWQAAQVARKDDRWQYTNNAQAEYSKAAESILKMFGFR